MAIDVSPVAVDIAKQFVDSSTNPASANVRLGIQDFFAEKGPYDLIYDYTFFVVLLPSRRGEWGRQMTVLAKSGGYLVTLLFPILDQPEVRVHRSGQDRKIM